MWMKYFYSASQQAYKGFHNKDDPGLILNKITCTCRPPIVFFAQAGNFPEIDRKIGSNVCVLKAHPKPTMYMCLPRTFVQQQSLYNFLKLSNKFHSNATMLWLFVMISINSGTKLIKADDGDYSLPLNVTTDGEIAVIDTMLDCEIENSANI